MSILGCGSLGWSRRVELSRKAKSRRASRKERVEKGEPKRASRELRAENCEPIRKSGARRAPVHPIPQRSFELALFGSLFSARSFRLALLGSLFWSSALRALRLPEPFCDRVPVDHVPPRRDIIWPAVLVLEVVRVFPHVQPHNRLLSLHQGIVLVRRARDRELAVALIDQPGPSRAESPRTRGGELFLELRDVPKGALDRISDPAFGFAPFLRPHQLPKHRVIPVAAAVVSHRGPDGFGYGADTAHQVVQ